MSGSEGGACSLPEVQLGVIGQEAPCMTHPGRSYIIRGHGVWEAE